MLFKYTGLIQGLTASGKSVREGNLSLMRKFSRQTNSKGKKDE